LTKYEKYSNDDILFKYDAIKCLGMILGFITRRAIGYFSHIIRETKTNYYSGFFWGIAGFYLAQIIGLRLVSEKSEFIKKRLIYEKKINFIRNNDSKIHEEYPFENESLGIFSDNYIKLGQYEKNFNKGKKTKIFND
jgi:hypothetical protein